MKKYQIKSFQMEYGERVNMRDHMLQSAVFAERDGASNLVIAAAKRYLCATDAEYDATVSPASLQSLALQGGPFSSEEVAQFEANPYFRLAIQVRRYDEAGKEVGMQTPTIEAYRPIIEKALKGRVNHGT
ncbi:MAG: hypothetical protein AAF633_10405 [Chloroflexota bacterium]